MIEGWSARLFRAKLQPVQIAKRLIRAMESHQTVSLSKTFVPNSFVVSLSAVDYAGFEQYRRSLEQDLAEGVLGAARDRNYTLLAFPNVEIERDEDLAPGDMRVSCALVDATGEEVTPDPKALGAVEAGHTMVLDVGGPALGCAYRVPRAPVSLSGPCFQRAPALARRGTGGRGAAGRHRVPRRAAQRPGRPARGRADAAPRGELDRPRRRQRRRPQ